MMLSTVTATCDACKQEVQVDTQGFAVKHRTEWVVEGFVVHGQLVPRQRAIITPCDGSGRRPNRVASAEAAKA